MLFSKAYATKLNIPTQGLQGSRPPNILTSVLFFPFSGTSEYRKSLSFSVVLAIVFYCLGHFKNVYDDDDDDFHLQCAQCTVFN